MRVIIREGRPGELAERAEDLIKVLEHLTAGECLCKAHRPAEKLADEPPKGRRKKLPYPALEQAVTRASPQVERIRKIMLARIENLISKAAK